MLEKCNQINAPAFTGNNWRTPILLLIWSRTCHFQIEFNTFAHKAVQLFSGPLVLETKYCLR